MSGWTWTWNWTWRWAISVMVVGDSLEAMNSTGQHQGALLDVISRWNTLVMNTSMRYGRWHWHGMKEQAADVSCTM